MYYSIVKQSKSYTETFILFLLFTSTKQIYYPTNYTIAMSKQLLETEKKKEGQLEELLSSIEENLQDSITLPLQDLD